MHEKLPGLELQTGSSAEAAMMMMMMTIIIIIPVIQANIPSRFTSELNRTKHTGMGNETETLLNPVS